MKFYKYLVPAALLISTAACTENVMDDINEDTYNPKPDMVAVKLQLTEALMATGFSTTSGDYAFYTASLTEQELGSGNNQLMKAELRNPSEWAASTTFNNVWNSTYSNLYNIKEMIRKIEENVNEQGSQLDILGAAQVLWVINFGILTDAHGDIPYSEACQGLENKTPKVDSQESIYADLMQTIDKAITNLQAAADAGLNNAKDQDIAYKGNSAKWLAAAYAVKARYALHQVNVNPAAWAIAKDAAQTALDLGFTDFSITSFNGITCDNPWSAFYWSRAYTASSNTVCDLMDATGDPRLLIYTYEDMVGYAPGDEQMSQMTYYQIVPMWLDNGGQAVTLIGVPEVNFILAECQLHDGEDATAAYLDGVTAAVETVYDATWPLLEAYGLDSMMPAASDFAATLPTPPTIEDVYAQKYLSQIIDGQFEGYNDIRRVAALGDKFVDLTNPYNVQSGVNRWPELLPYGNSAVISNPNVTKLYGDGYYIYTTKCWLYK